jgi:acetyl esterase
MTKFIFKHMQSETRIQFDLHGGGFMLGSADTDEEMSSEPVNRWAVRSPASKRQSPPFPYPTVCHQVYAVVKHLLRT